MQIYHQTAGFIIKVARSDNKSAGFDAVLLDLMPNLPDLS
jgi:hypothetical protein